MLTDHENAVAAFGALETQPLGAADIPATVAEARKRARVVGERRERPLPVWTEYVHISVHDDFTTERFNCVKNLVTQSAEIAGVTLIFDDLDHNSPLRSFDQRLDLRNLTIYADRVVFRSAHRFHRTNVTIYARELVFEDDGCIDTTPRVQLPASKAPRDNDNYPVNYKAADGVDGEPAGTVTIHVQDVILGTDAPAKDATDGKPVRRIVAVGQAGQDGEAAGLKRYTPGQGQSGNKKLDPITLSDLQKKLRDLGHVDGNFHYPAYSSDGVVSASLVAYVPVGPMPVLDQLFLPGPTKMAAIKFKSFGVPDFSFWWSSVHGVRPGDGESAYPAGDPGSGGKGGDIVVEHQGQCPAAFAERCDSRGGPGGTSPGRQGEDPGEPANPRHAIVFAVEAHADGSGYMKRTPFVDYQGVAGGSRGENADTKQGGDGGPGATTVRKDGNPMWMHPLVVDAVIGYARDAYRAGYREDAEAALERYATLLSAKNLPAALIPRRIAVQGMLTNLANNLDYYGNNVGWVPRLNATNSLEFFELDRTNTSRLLYFADTLATKWDMLKRTSEAADRASTALEDEIDIAQDALLKANDDFDEALKDLRVVDADLLEAKRHFQKVYDRISAIAQHHVEVENTVKGMCKLAGGLAKVVPVGQPYLGLAGDIVGELGNFDWTDEDGAFTWEHVSSNFEGFGKKVGKTIDDFRDTHRDLLIKDQLQPGKDSLKRKIKDAKGAMKNLDNDVKDVNAQIDDQWIALRDGELVALRKRIGEIDDQLKVEPEQPALKEKKRTFVEELREVAKERLQSARVRLEHELTNKTAELEKKDADRKKVLREKVQALEKQRETKQAGIDKLKTKEEQREKKANEAFDAMAGIGDGIAKMGAGVSAVFAKVDADNPKMKALMENVKTSAIFPDDVKKGYFDLLDSLEEIGAKKTRAVSKLLGVQQQIAQHTSTIADGLSDLVALGRQRQALDGVLGIEARQHLQGMRDRAKERLHAYLYEFIKAFQYQYLSDVPASFYNFDTWVDRLVALESVDAEGVRTMPTLAKIQEIEKQVITSEYLEMARAIVLDRQKRAGASSNSYTCTLNASQLQKLLDKGHLTFNLLDDFDTNATLAMKDARIEDITLTTCTLTLAKGAGSPNLNISFEHSGTSILRDGDGQFWFFQKGATDDPIRWRYVWKPPKLVGTKTVDNFEKDTVDSRDRVLEALLKADEIKFREHRPGLLSPVTLWINQDKPAEELKRYVEKFDAVTFDVKFVYR
jgi:hypothetical protein